MTSIAETKPSASLGAQDRAPSRNFNLRAYLAGAGATTALIAGAIVVFTSLATYVAFNGLPIGSGNENASQLTISASEVTTPRAGRLLARAASAVAATAAAPTATAAGGANGTAGSGPGAGPGGGETQTPTGVPPTGTTVDPTVSPNGTAPTGGGSGPVSGAVGEVSNATGLPLSGPTSGVTQAADEALGNLGQGLQDNHAGQSATNAVNGLTGSLGLGN